MILLALFQALLSRISGQDTVVVGTPVAGRHFLEIEGLIGFFVNTLVLRGDFGDGLSFQTLLARTRESALEAQEHQDLPFEKLVGELQPERSLSHSPVFQVMFSFQNLPMERLDLAGLRLRGVPSESETSKFDLSLAMHEQDGLLAGAMTYDRDLFDRTTVERLLRSLKRLAAAAVATPERPLEELPILGAPEEHQTLVEWGQGPPEKPAAVGLAERLAEAVERTPDAVAVVDGEIRWSYRELGLRSWSIARDLRAAGVGPERIVGVYLPPRADLVAALIGIWWAGGAYLPLDPELPEERLQLLLNDARVSVVVTDEVGRRELPEDVSALVLERRPPAAPVSLELAYEITRPAPDGLAYVIYTSGSTGRPKGVAVDHREAARHFDALLDRYRLGADDHVLQFASPSFDASLVQIVPPLLVGGTLVMRGPEPWSPSEIRSRVARLRLTVMHLPTAYWHQWVPALPGVVLDPDGLRLMAVGGEALSAPAVRHWRHTVLGGARLLNSYGPTEAVVTASHFEVTDAVAPGLRSTTVAIGRALAGRRARVLDRAGRPRPMRTFGELCLGGVLARGYLRRPSLSAERFVPDPFDDRPGARLYRTGDLACWLPSGDLEFAGRFDHQVKIRGFRVELGEVETHLLEDPRIADVAVDVRGESADRRLVAYVVPSEDGGLNDLRQQLERRLPRHLVPSAFIRVEKIPRGPSGKVSRAALPDPVQDRLVSAGHYAPPRDALEFRLVAIWEEILEITPVGITDDFFDIGGHSMLALRLMGAIAQELGKELPVAMLFETSTIEGLAHVLRRGSGVDAGSALVRIAGARQGEPWFWVHAVGGQVTCYLTLARRLGAGGPVYGLQATGKRHPETLEEMAALYAEALREVRPEGPYRLGGWSMGGVIAFEMAQQLRRRGERIESLVLVDAPVPDGKAERTMSDRELLESFSRDLMAVQGLVGREISGEIPELGDGTDLHDLVSVAQASGLLPKELGAGEIELHFEVFKRNQRALQAYRAERYPGEVHLIVGDRGEGGRDQMVEGWRTLVAGMDVVELPADHYALLREPHVSEIAERLLDLTGGSREPEGSSRGTPRIGEESS
jgi:amino acid adenylation domain-containing protein